MNTNPEDPVEIPDDLLQVGDVVRLASGGPKMTINSILSMENITNIPQLVACCWFTKSGKFRSESFECGALVMEHDDDFDEDD